MYREMKCGVVMAKAAVNKKKNLLTRNFELKVGEKVVKSYIYFTAAYGAENWTLLKIYQKHQVN